MIVANLLTYCIFIILCLQLLLMKKVVLFGLGCCRIPDDLNRRLFRDFSNTLLYFCSIYDHSLNMTSWNYSKNIVNTFVMTGIRPYQPIVLPIFTYTLGGKPKGKRVML